MNTSVLVEVLDEEVFIEHRERFWGTTTMYLHGWWVMSSQREAERDCMWVWVLFLLKKWNSIFREEDTFYATTLHYTFIIS